MKYIKCLIVILITLVATSLAYGSVVEYTIVGLPGDEYEDIIIDDNGNIYITDIVNKKLEKISIDLYDYSFETRSITPTNYINFLNNPTRIAMNSSCEFLGIIFPFPYNKENPIEKGLVKIIRTDTLQEMASLEIDRLPREICFHPCDNIVYVAAGLQRYENGVIYELSVPQLAIMNSEECGAFPQGLATDGVSVFMSENVSENDYDEFEKYDIISKLYVYDCGLNAKKILRVPVGAKKLEVDDNYLYVGLCDLRYALMTNYADIVRIDLNTLEIYDYINLGDGVATFSMSNRNNYMVVSGYDVWESTVPYYGIVSPKGGLSKKVWILEDGQVIEEFDGNILGYPEIYAVQAIDDERFIGLNSENGHLYNVIK